MRRNEAIVPAVMFHSVGLEKHDWAWSHISEPVELFEAKIAALAKAGFTGVFWSELYEYMAGRVSLPANSILLTFDDGYLDNWVCIYPILKKYGMKGTIFMSTDFVDPRTEPRPSLEDLWSGRCARGDIAIPGFLSWAEMRRMEESGLVDIQSHAVTHTWYFTGPRIVDYHRPFDVTPRPWLFWNARPERKPYYLSEDQQEFLPWGHPVFEHAKSLVAKRFFPDESAVEAVTGLVAEEGGRELFTAAGWRERLERRMPAALSAGQFPGRYESEEERVARIADELRRSKRAIEENLRKRADFICWPGGGNDVTVQEIARTAGYKGWTLGSRSQLEKRNLPGTDPESIKRIGSGNEITFKGRRCGTGGARWFTWKIFAHQGSFVHAAAMKGCKLGALAASFGGAR